MEELLFLFVCCSFLPLFLKFSVAVDSIAPNQTITDGQTLVSICQSFEFGFFSSGNSKNRYLGIWYMNILPKTVVWVANRDTPLTDFSGVVTINDNGNLILLYQTKGVIWSSNSSRAAKSPIFQLLDSGNLVLRDERDGNSENYLWQSFDHPSDSLIPGMKLGWNLKTSQNWYLISWKSIDDPSPGDYTYRLDPGGLPQIVLRNGPNVKYRSGPWDGVRFGGGPEMQNNSVFKPIFTFQTEDAYYTFQDNDNSVISRFVLNQSGFLQHLRWNSQRLEWVVMVNMQQDDCDKYGYCGAYGVCNINNSPVCECLKGFNPRSPRDWNVLDWTGGCIPRSESLCRMKEGFRKFSKLKLPDKSQINRSMNPSECEAACLSNCSCKAYGKTEVGGCVFWFDDLNDIREYSEGGQDLYIRMAATELDSDKKEKLVVVIVVLPVVLGVLLLGSISWCIIWSKKRNRSAYNINNQDNDYTNERPEEDLELPLFDVVTIAAATSDFSYANKIGEGGFGPVYKGELSTGQEIAVKRLSKDSRQGLKELKNEVILIAKLQHRNLVRLLGCCIQGEERMLIYEYMPNKSLDSFIFGHTRGTSLDWHKRFNIIMGIARGLLYLHQDSRLRIIHRDLKASNILLDSEMNPKISDFGTARIFGCDQTEAKTKRVIGTYGYMSPEYAIDGLFSVKSDIYSFGVLILEIVSGKKNRGFSHPDHDLNLLGHAWKLWNEYKALEVADVSMNTVSEDQVIRCIQVGLLCVQQRPEDRPTMSSVVLMLSSESAILPQPKQPGFYTQRFLIENSSSSTERKSSSINGVTVTLLEGR